MNKLIINPLSLIAALFLILCSQETHASNHVIEVVNVTGNNRIDSTTIVNYSGIKAGDAYDKDKIDDSLKRLYETELFSNIEIKYSESILAITVEENFLINAVVFEGNKSIDDESLEALVQLKARSTFSTKKLENDISKIINAYRAAGRYSIFVEPKIIKLDFNRINLIFEVNEGNVTKITDINFIGNNNYSDRKLRNAIATKRSIFFDKIWGTGKSYDNALMEYDIELLKQFYKNNGYVNFKVLSSVAELNDQADQFVITFTVDEGERYNFGEITVTNQLNNNEISLLSEDIKTVKSKTYSEKTIETSSLAIISSLRQRGNPFVQVNVIEKIDELNKTIDINYVISDGPSVYIERIDISGNQRTFDYVLRRELLVAEGDALNQTYLNKSLRNLRSLNFFSDVKADVVSGSAPDRRVVKISIVEKPTGSIVFGGGYSTYSGAVATIDFSERNLLGKGQQVSLGLSIGGNQNLINLIFTEPAFLGSDVTAGFDLYGNETDYTEQSGYKNKEVGTGVRFGFPLSDELKLALKYSYTNNEVYGVPSTAALSIRQLEGINSKSEIGYGFDYSTLDNSLTPSNGIKVQFGQDFAGFGADTEFLRTTLSGDYYTDFTKDVVGSLSLDIGHIFGLNDQSVKITDAFMNPGPTLRGFEPRGISPRLKADDGSEALDGSNQEAVGGNTYFASSVALQFPIPTLTEDYGVKGGLHLNAGTLFGSDIDDALLNESSSIRTSIGASIFWDSPIGPLRFDFTEAINNETFDRTEFFQFSGGTSF